MLTVTTAAETYDLVRLGDVMTALDVSDNSQQSKFKLLIGQASGAISKYCNRVFAQETLSETFRLTCREDGLLLARAPATSVTSLVENDIALAATDYELLDNSGVLNRLRSDRKWQWPIGKVVVTYVAGYTLAAMPQDIVRATTMLIDFYRYRDGTDIMKRSSSIDGVATHSFQDFPVGSVLPPEIEGMVSQFRKPAGG